MYPEMNQDSFVKVAIKRSDLNNLLSFSLSKDACLPIVIRTRTKGFFCLFTFQSVLQNKKSWSDKEPKIRVGSYTFKVITKTVRIYNT